MKKLENFMIYAIMILSFLMYSSVTQNTIVITFTIWPIIFLSAICILYRIFNYKDYQLNTFHKYLLIFIISYMLSSLLNMAYGYYQNLRSIILMLILVALIYTKTKDDKKTMVDKYSNIFIIITTILSISTLLIFNISQIFINIGNENLYLTGLRWGRIKGAYNDFNYGGMINAIAIIMAIYFCNKNKSKTKKIIYVFSILVNFTFIILSDSRSSLIALIGAIIVYIFMYVISKEHKIWKKIGSFFAIFLIVISILFVGRMSIKKLFSYIYDNEEERVIVNIGETISIVKEENEELTNNSKNTETNKDKTIDNKDEDDVNDNKSMENKSDDIFYRGYSKSKDISNRRFDLWKSSIEIFKTSPIYGVSFENVEKYCYAKLQDTYLVNNGYKVFDNFHNLIFNVLASQGIIGIVILVGILIYLATNILKYIFLLTKKRVFDLQVTLMLSCITIGAVSTIFIGDIVYYISPSTVTFYFFLGYLINEIDKSTGKNIEETKIMKAIKKGRRIFLVHVFNLFPIKNNRIIFSNFSGKAYGDNCKYILEEINNRKISCDLIWVLENKDDKKTLPNNVRFVEYNSIKYFYNICTAKIWVDNHRKIIDLHKRKNQYYIQTWHGGIALKKIEKDAIDALNPKYIKQAKHDSNMIDLMISNSKFCTNMYKTAFWYNGEILEVGSPRNDILVKNNSTDKAKIYNKLNIDKDKKVVLYAPTFRKDEGLENYDINFEKLINTLNQKYEDEWIVLLRLHPNIANRSNELIDKDIIDVSNYGDMYELMLIADVLISDYSSVMFEFALTQKPVFLYAKDIDDYIEDRGFYFDYYGLPFSVATDNDELTKNILDYNPDEYKIKTDNFFKELGLFENGDASKKVVDIIEKSL